MDLRTERTKRSIINAFLELRSKKPLEKITVKELAELAFINKATFYTHYRDIYDLSEQLETEFITNILNQLPSSDFIFSNTKEGTERLFLALSSQKAILDILFSGNRFSALASRLENGIKEHFYEKYPEHRNNLEFNNARRHSGKSRCSARFSRRRTFRYACCHIAGSLWRRRKMLLRRHSAVRLTRKSSALSASRRQCSPFA